MIAPSSEPAADALTASSLLRTGFNVEVEIAERTAVLHLRGELDMATARQLSAALLTTMAGEVDAVALDLSRLTFVDSTGIAVFLSAGRRALAEGRAFSLHHPTRTVAKTLHLTGVDRLLEVTPEAAADPDEVARSWCSQPFPG